MVVIIAVGIIAGLTIPSYLRRLQVDRIPKVFADMEIVADAIENYYKDNGFYPPEVNLYRELVPKYLIDSPDDPYRKTEGAPFRYYTNATSAYATDATAWLLVCNGPDTLLDVTEQTPGFTWDEDERVSGRLGGPGGVVSGYGIDLWYDPATGIYGGGDIAVGGGISILTQ